MAPAVVCPRDSDCVLKSALSTPCCIRSFDACELPSLVDRGTFRYRSALAVLKTRGGSCPSSPNSSSNLELLSSLSLFLLRCRPPLFVLCAFCFVHHDRNEAPPLLKVPRACINRSLRCRCDRIMLDCKCSAIVSPKSSQNDMSCALTP